MHFTLTALLVTTNNWYLNIDDGLINSVLFLDLKKPLIQLTTAYCWKKLQLYGLDRHAVQWFKSYLANRFQSIYVNKTLSDYLPISCGVPQGSFLRPLLFLNDLQECELSSFALMYADDTSLTLSAYDPTTLEEKLKKDLDKVQKWLKSNKLTLNVKKTKLIYDYWLPLPTKVFKWWLKTLLLIVNNWLGWLTIDIWEQRLTRHWGGNPK